MKIRWRVIRWVGIVILVGLLAAAVSLVWYLQSDAFQKLARNEVMSRLQSATGMQVGIGQLRVDLLNRNFEVRGLTLSPQPGHEETFRLSLDEARGKFRLGVLIRMKPHISELVLVRPRIRLTSGTGSSTWQPDGFLKVFKRSLDLAIDRVLVTDGWLDLNNRRIPFAVDLEDLDCSIVYLRPLDSYEVKLGYRNGLFDWADRKIRYDLNSELRIGLYGVDFQSIRLRHDESVLTGDGSLRDWRSPVLRLNMRGPLAGRDLSLVDEALADARGSAQVAFQLRWDHEGFRMTGDFSAEEAQFRAVRLARLRGAFDLKDDVFQLSNVTVGIGGGSAKLDGIFQLSSRNDSPHRVRISARNVPLSDAAVILKEPEIAFENSADADLTIAWRHGTQDLTFQASTRLHGLPLTQRVQSRRLTLDGSADIGYARGVWSISNASLRSPATTVTVSSAGKSDFSVHLLTSRIAEPMSLLQAISPDISNLVKEEPEIMEATGTFELDGVVHLARETPATFVARISARDGRWRSYRVDSVAADASWDGRTLDLKSLKALLDGQTIEGHLALRKPESNDEPYRLSFDGRLKGLSVATLRGAGLDISPDVAGDISGEGSVSYEGGNWTGQGTLDVENLSVGKEKVDSLRSRLRLGRDRLEVQDATLRRGLAEAEVRGSIRRSDRAMKLALSLKGLKLSEIPGLTDSGVPVEGSISAAGSLAGTFDEPAFDGKFELKGLHYSSLDLGEGSGTLKLAGRILEATAGVESGLGKLEGQARISIEPGFAGKASIDFHDWNLQKLVPAEIPRIFSDLSTALQGRLEVEGKFAEPSSLVMRGDMDGARLKIRGYDLHNQGKIRFSVANKMLHVDEAKFIGEGSDLTLSGDVPAPSATGLNLKLAGNVNLKVADLLVEKLHLSGSAGLDVRASGTLNDPEVIGQANLDGVQLDYNDLPFNLSGVEGRLVFSRDVVRLERIRGKMAAGTFDLAGVAEQKAGEIQSVNLQINIRRARVPYPKDFRTTFNAKLELSGNLQYQLLSGQVNVARAEYLRPISLLEQFARRGGGSGALVSVPALKGLRLNVDLQSNQGLIIDDETVQMRGSFRLRLRGTPAYPSLVGYMEANEGSILFRGNRFEFVFARADFYDRSRINPNLSARAEVDLKRYRMILDVKGPLDKLVFNLTSDPPLSTSDAVYLLASGQSGGAAQNEVRRESEVAGLSAGGFLSEGLTGGLTRQVERVFGFQNFRVDPFLAGTDNDPTARVTITRRISKDLVVTYSRNLSQSQDQIVILEFDVTKNFSIVATQDENGGYGLDFQFRKRIR
jgi:translocation and assembly module TamB